MWKRQYLFWLRLLRSSFIFSSHFKEGSSLICIRTCSSDVFNGMYYWFRAERPDFLLSRSFLSSIRPFFGWGPCSEWRVEFASIHSAIFLFLTMIASSAFMKFWVEWMSSTIDWGPFSQNLWMNRSELTPLWNAASNSLSSTSFTVRASLLKRVIKDHRLSFSHCSMVNKLDKERLCLCPSMKLLTNNLLNSSKELTEFNGILLNYTRIDPLRVVGKALHIISSGTPWRCIVVLKVAMWSKGSRGPSYKSK